MQSLVDKPRNLCRENKLLSLALDARALRMLDDAYKMAILDASVVDDTGAGSVAPVAVDDSITVDCGIILGLLDVKFVDGTLSVVAIVGPGVGDGSMVFTGVGNASVMVAVVDDASIVVTRIGDASVVVTEV